MAKRRKTKKKTTASRNNLDPDIAVILLVILGILSCVIIYGNAGSVGETLSPFLGGCFGIIKYIIPIVIFCTAYSITKDSGKFARSKIFQI